MLAAGGSTRLGEPKQLLTWRGETLLHRAARTALEAGTGPVVVVLGACVEPCRAALEDLDVAILVHNEWMRGVGSTIAVAVAEVERRHADSTAAIIAACDQPLVGAADLAALRGASRERRLPMAAAGYAGTVGIPALFSRAMFGELKGLEGDAGAARLLRSRPDQVAVVACPGAGSDVDQRNDLGRLA